MSVPTKNMYNSCELYKVSEAAEVYCNFKHSVLCTVNGEIIILLSKRARTAQLWEWARARRDRDRETAAFEPMCGVQPPASSGA